LLTDQLSTDHRVKAFVNGQWFNGTDFLRRTFYCVEGKLATSAPSNSVNTIDLQGGFMVPPFGDAHNHFPSGEQDFAKANLAHLKAGVFYTLNPGGNAEIANPIRPRLNTAATIDAIFAHGVFTCSGGHPGPLLEFFADRGEPAFDKTKLNGRYFYFVDSVADLDRVWPQFLSTNPEFVKLILGFSSAYRSGEQRSVGLSPRVAQEITRRARTAGLRTGAHIENAEDFHTALEAGVDLVMHLPIFPEPFGRKGAYPEIFAEPDCYVISTADAKLAFVRGVGVVTTCATGSAENFEKPNAFEKLNEKEAQFVKITLQNLRQLKDEGVTLAVGSDGPPGAGTVNEIAFLQNTGLFSNLELLKMWSETTPRTIFPQRKIGRFEDGYEASFLVLDMDPIRESQALEKIRMRVKQGSLIDQSEID
jgi:imidazolonepropionase-like amidohydrolase